MTDGNTNISAFALLHFAQKSFETASTLKYGSHKSRYSFCGAPGIVQLSAVALSKGRLRVEITGAPCVRLAALR